MRRILKWIGTLLLLVVLGIAGLVAYAWQRSQADMAQRYTIADAPLTLPRDAESLAHGRHLFESRGCTGCHGDGGDGAVVMDAGPVARIVASNLTPAVLAARGYDAHRIAVAIRHGVRPDGTPLIFMPSHDYAGLSDADTAALVGYMATLPDSSNDPGRTEVRPLGRVLHVLGKFPLLPAGSIDHAPRVRPAPPMAATAEYGGYIAAVCAGCHGADLAGGAPLGPDAPPVANLTPAALEDWTEADFVRVMRQGVRPDGRALHRTMPWRAFASMTELELRALWLHLRSLPPAETGSR